MLYIIREYLTMVLEWLMGKAHFFAGETAEADIALDPFVLIALVLLATLAMISGFWAGSIAASRRHAMWLHILLGMALPFAYPVAILFTLDLHGAKEREQAKREKEETAKAEQAERERVAQLAGRQAAKRAQQHKRQAEEATMFAIRHVLFRACRQFWSSVSLLMVCQDKASPLTGASRLDRKSVV